MSRTFAVALGALALLPAAAQAAGPELSTTDRLPDRRYVAAGDRAYIMGYEDGTFPAQGWHIGGEMGGVWSQPLKLVDGVWFAIDGQWLAPAKRFTSGWGYTRLEYARNGRLDVSRTDFVPDGVRGALFGLNLRNRGAARTVEIRVDAHAELLGHYPWQWTKPNSTEANRPDSGAFDAPTGTLAFREEGQPYGDLPSFDRVAFVGSNRRPTGGEAGPGHRGSQEPAVICQDENVPDEQKRNRCDDSVNGKGTGGQLRYSVRIPARRTRTLWIAVAGSDRGAADGRAQLARALRNPARALATKKASRLRAGNRTKLSLPGDRLLAQAIEWGKQNLLDQTQRADDLRIRDVDEGKAYPPPLGTVARARWIGAGYPDYPWIFATDGEYTGFAAVSVGQFEAIKDHARALRDVSVILNGTSGKVAHEIVADGSVYFGALHHKGNTDETAKFPSMVALIWRWTGDNRFRDDLYPFAKRNLEFIFETLDADKDGWPEGLGNVERSGMGDEKLDNTVYTMRGLADLADMAEAKGDTATRTWALERFNAMITRFDTAWWMPSVNQFADSLRDPGNQQVQQKHWIGVTPMEAEITRGVNTTGGVAIREHAIPALAERETACYSGSPPYNQGLMHTGCGGGPAGKGEPDVFSLNTAIMAVGEGNYGRLGATQQRRYTDANRELMLPLPDEQPGAMPEIAPSPPPRGRNIDRCSRCRSMVMQAWGNYGTMWPVVHQQLGVAPDLGRRRLAVIPQPPSTAPIGARNIRLGRGAINVFAVRGSRRYVTTVSGRPPVRRLWVGQTLPLGSRIRSVKLDGRSKSFRARETNRGLEVSVSTRPGAHRVEIRTR